MGTILKTTITTKTKKLAKSKRRKASTGNDLPVPKRQITRKAEEIQMWKEININKNLIKLENGRSVLIALPHSSGYNGYSFWFPAKLVRKGKNSAAVSLSYTDEFSFILVKYGKGRYNHDEVIDEVTLTADKFEAVFEVVDSNITSSAEYNPYETHKPKEMAVEAVEAIGELMDE